MGGPRPTGCFKLRNFHKQLVKAAAVFHLESAEEAAKMSTTMLGGIVGKFKKRVDVAFDGDKPLFTPIKDQAEEDGEENKGGKASSAKKRKLTAQASEVSDVSEVDWTDLVATQGDDVQVEDEKKNKKKHGKAADFTILTLAKQ